MTDEARARDSRILTVPNVITLVRLLCVPVFLWLLLDRDDPVAAAVLLGALGATDWVDGYIARRFDQGSALGKVFDPVADRVLLVTAALALLANGSIPIWVGVLVLGREVLISVAVLALAAAGARRVEVQWSGKAGALALMVALPCFLLLDSTSEGHDLLFLVTWGFTIGGLVLSYYAAALYVPLARRALHEGRQARTEGASA
jgi:cardiolipin synthase (CMP-forming)